MSIHDCALAFERWFAEVFADVDPKDLAHAAWNAAIRFAQEEKGNETQTNSSPSTDAEVRLTESGA